MSDTILETLIVRGESYSVADTLIARAKLQSADFESRDGSKTLPKLDFLKGQTFDIRQDNLPQGPPQL